VVEFYFSLVLKELKGEEETGRRRFSGGSEGGMTALRFVSSRTEEGGSWQSAARRCGRRGGGAVGSRRWEPLEAGGGSRWRDENGLSDEMGRKPRRLQHKLFIFLNFKQDFRFKNQRFEILLISSQIGIN
jgi:hypothetical protein